MAHHVGMDFAPFRFFFAEKSVIMLRHSSFIAKGHIRVGYSVASALITPLAHYQPFASVPAAGISLWFGFFTKGEPKRYNVDLVSNDEGLL